MNQAVLNTTDSKLRSMLFQEKTGLCHPDFLDIFLTWMLADLPRSKRQFSVLRLAVRNYKELAASHADTAEAVASFLSERLRRADLIFATDYEHEYIVVLLHAGTIEAEYYFRRMEHELSGQDGWLSNVQLAAGMVAVSNGSVACDHIRVTVDTALQQALEEEPFHLEIGELQVNPAVQQIKVTIVDDDPIAQHILTNLIRGQVIDSISFDLQVFQDGHSFIQSDRYYSSHMHIIFLSDILPHRDGIEVLSDLRAMPNSEKYLIIMLGSRDTENEIIYTLEQGADEYIAKPFNIRLVEAKLKRMIKRRQYVE